MSVRISRALQAQIVAEAIKAAPHECCGLLLGDRAEDHVREVVSARNVAKDRHHAFEIDPAVLIMAYRGARSGGLAIIGHYHSHPGGPAEPSLTDAANAAPDGALWLIVTPSGIVSAWREGATGRHLGRFTPEEIAPA